MANTLATAASVPFAGAICDLIGRRYVALVGLLLTMVGMAMVGTAQALPIVIAGTGIVGIGSGLVELVASAGVLELAPVSARGKYVGLLSVVILPVTGSQAYGLPLRFPALIKLNCTVNRAGAGVPGSQ
jgi:MFS family permease